MSHRPIMIALLAAALLGLAGCAQPPGADGTASRVGAAGRSADLGFGATTLDGEPFRGASLRGRPAVLWFWTPWCPTCRAQGPAVSRLAARHAGEVTVVGVGALDDPSAIREVATEIPHVTHLVDADGEVWRHFRVTAQSTYTVIAADGRIVSEGYLDDGDLAGLVAALDAEARP